MIDSHPSSDLQEGPGLAQKPGFDGGLDRGNFVFVNRGRVLGGSDNENNPRDRKDRQPIQWVEAAKDIPWEKWPFDFFEPVGPSAAALVKRQKPFVALAAQVGCDDALVTTSDLQRKPRIVRLVEFHGALPNCAFAHSLCGLRKLPP